jgi:hypothetical protein
MVTALEGGINYWCASAKPKDGDYKGAEYASDSVSKGATLVLEQFEGEPSVELTKEKLLAGVVKYIEQEGISTEDHEELNDEISGADAGGADCIVQYAVFGELVYG